MTATINISFFEYEGAWDEKRRKRAREAVEAYSNRSDGRKDVSWYRGMADRLETQERMCSQGRELHHRIDDMIRHLSGMAGAIAYAYKKSQEDETAQDWESVVLNEIEKSVAVLKIKVCEVCAYPREVDEAESREKAEAAKE
jgi:hypothetical protein